MGTLFLSEMKKRASGFLQEKYKSARLALTDVTAAELLAEEATNMDPWGPNAKTMTRIAEASFDLDDYWRIVDILHRRLYEIDWKLWRQSYKALVLLEFLLTHGPEDFAEEFQCDADVIRDLGAFIYIDDKGFNWGLSMQKKSERILKLLQGGEPLKEARLKALKITKEIQGFGNLMASPSSSSSSSTPSSAGTSRVSFGSTFSSGSANSPSWHEINEYKKHDEIHVKDLIDFSPRAGSKGKPRNFDSNVKGQHLWDIPIEESGSLLEPKVGGREEEQSPNGFFGGICSRLKWDRSLSDNGRGVMKKKMNRQFSLRY